MTQSITERTVQVRAVVQDVHLMDAHPRQALCLAFDRVEQAHRLAVREGDDDVAAVADVIDDVRGIRCDHEGAGGRGGHVAHMHRVGVERVNRAVPAGG